MHFRYKIFFLALLGALFLLQPAGVVAATQRTISPQQWQQLTTDKAFDYKNEVEKQQQLPNDKPSKFWENVARFFRHFSNRTFIFIFYTLVAILVIYILYKLLLGNENVFFSKKRKTLAPTGNLLDEHMGTADWDALLKKAVAENDLQQAVRYSYMWLLQMLQDSQLITYRDDKTNYEYSRELEHTAYKQSFRQISRQYEYVIYGNFRISATTYNDYISLFNNIKQQLGR